jgi:hydroxymethylbilane synthase
MALRPDLEIVSIRGNVQTRLRRIDEDLDGGVLAAAGLKRLELSDRITSILEPEAMLPAVGQGALAIEARDGDEPILARLGGLEDPTSRTAIACERAFLGRLGGGCQVPIAGHARIDGAEIHFRGLVGSPDGSRVLRFEERLRFSANAQVEALGIRAAEDLLARGGRAILDAVSEPAGIPES